MSGEVDRQDPFLRLRRQAEATIAKDTLDLSEYSPQNLERLVYELRVHQIELRLQNEELLQMQFERELIHARYVDLYDSAPVGYVTLDDNGKIQEVNLTSLDLLARSRSKIIRQRLSRFVAPDDQDVYHFFFQKMAGLRTSAQSEVRLVRPDGSRFDALLEGRVVESNVSQTQDDEERQYRVTISDITATKQIRQELQDYQGRLQALFNHSLDAILIADDEAHYVDVNPAACTLLGYSREELLRFNIWDLTPALDRQTGRQLWQEFIDAGHLTGEYSLYRKDETEVIAEFSAVANIVPGLHLSVLRDITERKQKEAEMASLLERVSTKRERLRALTGQLAEAEETMRKNLARELHDRIGQNLTALNLHLSAARSYLSRDMPEFSPAITTIEQSLALVEKTIETTQDVLATLRPPVLDDYGLVASIRWFATEMAGQINLRVKIEGQEPSPRLTGPVEHTLFRIAQEALTNVVKHSHASQVTITLAEEPTAVQLVITDNGQGFDPDVKDTSLGRSTWGLLTMMERAESVGGQCRINSQPGQGTEIMVKVPR